MSLAARLVTGATGGLIATFSALWAAFKVVEWALGVATLPDNAEATSGAIRGMLGWVLEQDPNVTMLVAVALLFFFGLYMMAWAIRRTETVNLTRSGNNNASPKNDKKPLAVLDEGLAFTKTDKPSRVAETNEEREARYRLIDFITNFVVPAIKAYENFVLCSVKHITTSRLSVFNILYKYHDEAVRVPHFREVRDRLISSTNSGDISDMDMDALQANMILFKIEYRHWIWSAQILGKDVNVDVVNLCSSEFEEWRQIHNIMVIEGNNISRDIRIKGLYSPAGQNEFGDIIGSLDLLRPPSV